LTQPRPANACACGHLFGRLVEVQCYDGLWQLIDLEGMRVFELTVICPVCGRRFYWKRGRVRGRD
jgi:hypothetical protein